MRPPFRKALPGASVRSTSLRAHVLRAHRAPGALHAGGEGAKHARHTGRAREDGVLPVPISTLPACGRARGARIKAIILYPMNALASDQAQRFAREMTITRVWRAGDSGLYVGGRAATADHARPPHDEAALRAAPPDILLTNYKMLDSLLMRPEDRDLWRFNGPDTLRYLVLDELHSYDGAQGSDVACLIRRLKARLKVRAGGLACVGTSATIGGGGTSGAAAFAGEIFEEVIGEDALVVEDRLTLSEAFPPVGPDEAITQDAFAASDDALDPESYQTPDAFLDAQASLWVGEVPDSPVALGALLERHTFLRRLLEARDALGGRGPFAWRDLARRIGQAEPDFAQSTSEAQWLLLASFLALVAHARRLEGKPPPPGVQVSLWVRVEAAARGLKAAAVRVTPAADAVERSLSLCWPLRVRFESGTPPRGPDAVRPPSRAGLLRSWLRRRLCCVAAGLLCARPSCAVLGRRGIFSLCLPRPCAQRLELGARAGWACANPLQGPDRLRSSDNVYPVSGSRATGRPRTVTRNVRSSSCVLSVSA